MKLSTSLVAVKKITSNKPRSSFPNDELEQAAKLILESEGVINPIVVRRTSLQSYEVVDGDFEYYAATRAREIDSRKGEMIGVFIVEPENEESITKQVELLRKSNVVFSNNVYPVSDSKESILRNIELRMTNTEARVTNVESRFDNRINELQADFKHEVKTINERLNEIENRIPRQIEPLEALNTLSLSELTSKLKRVNVNSKIIEKIISDREKVGKFKSFSNVVERIKGLGEKTLLKIIDSFSEL
ncbi:ParB N-terminal domain-containing protein [Tolypothrix sp. VBCCA 56010]|uniref:ParB N-terminal domain-containing protein n=1 Tax=Tolypothrix sp. VBCCA 56010 TaxID=3137731 RepID=UPI003D7D93D2